MNYLILGGNGYLGSKVTRKLVQNGNNVVLTKRPHSNLRRISDLTDQIQFIPASVDAVETVLKYQNIDWVLNMASNYGRSDLLYDTVIESNIIFPLRILNLVTEQHRIEGGGVNFLTIGTGLPDELNMYSYTKKSFSDFGKFYSDKHGINFINVKLEMFYGSDEPDDRFLKHCVLSMLRNKDLDLTDGLQKRDIIFSEDVIDAIFYAMDYYKDGYNEILVGTGEAPTIREIIEYIKQITNSTSKLNFGVVPKRKAEPDCVADSNKLKEIGFSCKYGWKDGLLKMIEEVKSYENID